MCINLTEDTKQEIWVSEMWENDYARAICVINKIAMHINNFKNGKPKRLEI